MGMGDCVPLAALGVGNQQRTLVSHIAQKPFAIPNDNTEEGWEEQEEQLTIK